MNFSVLRRTHTTLIGSLNINLFRSVSIFSPFGWFFSLLLSLIFRFALLYFGIFLDLLAPSMHHTTLIICVVQSRRRRRKKIYTEIYLTSKHFSTKRHWHIVHAHTWPHLIISQQAINSRSTTIHCLLVCNHYRPAHSNQSPQRAAAADRWYVFVSSSPLHFTVRSSS